MKLFLPQTDLPVAEAEAVAIPVPPRSLAATILVIDDDPDVRRFLCDFP